MSTFAAEALRNERSPSIGRDALAVLVLLVLSYALGQLEYLGPARHLPITPRDLTLGLSAGVLIAYRKRALPFVVLGAFLGELGNGHFEIASAAWVAFASSAQAAVVAFSSLYVSRRARLFLLKNELVAALLMSGPVVFTLGTVKAYVLAHMDMLNGADLWGVLIRSWIGDGAGLLIIMPLCLVQAVPGPYKRITSRQIPELILQGILVALAVWYAFGAYPDLASRYFYGIFFPMTWIVLRHGLRGSILTNAALQAGLILALSVSGHEDVRVTLFQGLILVVASLSLIFGILTDLHRATELRLRAREDEVAARLRLAATGELAGTLAHEIGHPLAAIANYAAALNHIIRKSAPDDAEAKDITSKLNQEIVRATETLRRLGDFFRTGSLTREPTDLARLVSDTISLLKDRLGHYWINPQVLANEGPYVVHGDKVQLQAVIYNLLVNAIDALQTTRVEERRLSITLSAHDDVVRLAVDDSGGGISNEVKADLFDPLVTTKEHGLGLGLAMSRSVIKAHQGSIAAKESILGGAQFTITLPKQPLS